MFLEHHRHVSLLSPVNVNVNPFRLQWGWHLTAALFMQFFSFAEEDDSSLKRSELINWYLKEIESEIESEEQLINKKKIIERVIHRLTHYVRTEMCGR